MPTTIRQGIGTALHHGSQTNSPTAKSDKNDDGTVFSGGSPQKSTASGGSGRSDSIKSPSDSTNEKKKTKEGKIY